MTFHGYSACNLVHVFHLLAYFLPNQESAIESAWHRSVTSPSAVKSHLLVTNFGGKEQCANSSHSPAVGMQDVGK